MNNQLYKDIIRHIFCKGENDMANYYRVAYKESQNTLKQICELFRVDSSDITIKFVVAVMGRWCSILCVNMETRERYAGRNDFFLS